MAFRKLSADEFRDLIGYASLEQWTQGSFGSGSVDVLLERMREVVRFD